MTTEYSGAGDPTRSLELLWGVPDRSKRGPKRGPKPRLSAEEIVRTATVLADTEGLEAPSMRRIADELGVSPMSIYTYVPGKAELIDVMVDRVFGELTPAPGDTWRARLEHVARDHWALFHRHPWLLRVTLARPPMGPNTIAKYENELRAVEGIGLTDLEMDSVVALVTGFAESAARVSVNAAEAERRSGVSDAEWWEAVAPVLNTFVNEDDYPIATRVGTAAGMEYSSAISPGRGFEFGLARILDGIEALIGSR